MNEKKAFWSAVVELINQQTQAEHDFVSVSPVSGGDINAAYHLVTLQSSPDKPTKLSYFVKVNDFNLSDMFEAEKLGLEFLANTQVIKVPLVVAYGQVDTACDIAKYILVLEHLRFAPTSEISLLAKHLAQLHQISHKKYGFFHNNYIGKTPQQNSWQLDWISFFKENRLSFQLRLLMDKAKSESLSVKCQIKAIIAKTEELLKHLDKFFVGYNPKPALLHGDLWQGNWHYVYRNRLSKGKPLESSALEPVIFDPACYFGDHEADLAMMELFGSLGPLFFQSYAKHYPIHHGYAIRKPLYNLYHIFNHANLFGGNYYTQAEQTLDLLLAS